MRACATAFPLFLCLASSCAIHSLAAAPKKPKVAPPSALQAELKKVSLERDELRERVAALASLQQDLASVTKGRDLARQEAEACQREVERLKAVFDENQASGAGFLKDLQKAQVERDEARAAFEKARKELEDAQARLKGKVDEGALVMLTPDIAPAKPINLKRVTPSVKKVDPGVVVIHVLVSENGEVLDARLIQGLPGEGEAIQKAHAACLEAAKRVVFDPARGADGKTRVRVWQGVGFRLE